MSIVIGVCYASAVFLLLQKRLLQIILGIALLGHASNLLIFVAAGLHGSSLPIIPNGADVLPPTAVDPLPQALILTAIVIGLALFGFSLALAYRCVAVLGHDDIDQITHTDSLDDTVSISDKKVS
ncbi:MAG: NADH-quinone oxidoreductase subunit K [Methyloprofundus sp.]|nr:NADH-quinone oxidoreductase subunit K [Methyloprofundus sp.]